MLRSRTGAILEQLRKLTTPGDDPASDRDLLRRFARQRDEAAFAVLVRRHSPMVLQLCRRMLANGPDAEDVCQAAFLVLASKAASRGWQESIAPWLHRVAYHLAWKVRAAASRRRDHESRVRVRPAADPVDEITGRELLSALDEELARLPEKYRAALVLCYLEGATRDEAARRLGWPLGTLKSRVERGRQLLHERLTRRGLSFSGVLPAALLTQDAARTAVPPSLVQEIIPTALLFSQGGTPTVASSLAASTLARGMLRAQLLSRLLTAGVWLLSAGVLAVTTGLAAQALWSAEPPDARSREQPRQPMADRERPAVAEGPGPRGDRHDEPLPEGALARLGESRFRHGIGITGAHFSPDGRLLATSGQTGGVCLWDAATGKELRRWPSDKLSLFLGFSPNSKQIALALTRDLPPRAFLWDIATGQEVGRLTPGMFSPDWKHVAVSHADMSFRLLETATGTEVRRIAGPRDRVSGAAFSPDGMLLAWVAGDKSIRLSSVATGEEVGRLIGHQAAVWRVQFAPDGKLLASVSQDKVIRLWDVPARRERHVLAGGFLDRSPLAFSPDGKLLATCNSQGRDIVLWETARGREFRRWQASGFGIDSIAFAPDGRRLVTTSSEDAVPRFWDVASGRELSLSRGHRGRVDWVEFSADGRTLFSGERNKIIRRWDLATGQAEEVLSLEYRMWGVCRSALSPDRKLAASWAPRFPFPDGKFAPLWTPGMDRSIRLWDTATGMEVRLLGTHDWDSHSAPAPWRALAFSPDGKRLATVDKERVVLWDLATGRRVREFLGLRGRIHCVAFSPDGHNVAAGTVIQEPEKEPTILIWAVATGKKVHAFGGGEVVEHLIFSPDGKLLGSAGYGQPVRLWDLATGEEHSALPCPFKEAYDLAFSPGGELIARGFGDGSIYLWETRTGREVQRFAVPNGVALSIAFAPAGRGLATGSSDGSIVLWDVTGRRNQGR